jgi:benzoate-CoA ligase family protein
MTDGYNAAEALVDRARDVYRDLVALRYGSVSVTFEALGDQVDRCANALRALGVCPEQRVVIAVPDAPAFVYAFFGAIKCGAVAVPLSASVNREELLFVLGESRAVVAVLTPELADAVASEGPALPHLRDVVVAREPGDTPDGRAATFLDLLSEASGPARPADTARDDACFWLYSSGTTGRPKACVHLQHDLVCAAEPYAREVLRLVSDDCLLGVSPLFHAYGLVMAVAIPLLVGASTVLRGSRRSTPQLVLELAASHRATVLITVPTLYAALLAELEQRPANQDLQSLRLCVSAGEALPGSVFERWAQRTGLDIVDGIGSTEMLGFFLSTRPRPDERHRSTPVPGYRVRIVNEEEQEVAPGQSGTLWVAGDSAFASYWRRHELTKATIRGEWIVTGDRFVQHPDGSLRYLGRADDLFKVAGEWVVPTEVEAVLRLHRGVQECAVVSRAEENGLPQVVAVIVPSRQIGSFGELVAELRAFVHLRLRPHQQPTQFVRAEALPTTASGKIQRYLLRGVLSPAAPASSGASALANGPDKRPAEEASRGDSRADRGHEGDAVRRRD